MHGENLPFRLYANARIPTGNIRHCLDQLMRSRCHVATRMFVRRQDAQAVVAETPEGLRHAPGEVIGITSGNDGKRAVQAVSAGLQYWRHAVG